MEFLLASQRKYRTRILLKQLLLLLLRILAIVGLVLLFAQPRWNRNLGGVLGGNRARHVVLLDGAKVQACTLLHVKLLDARSAAELTEVLGHCTTLLMRDCFSLTPVHLTALREMLVS